MRTGIYASAICVSLLTSIAAFSSETLILQEDQDGYAGTSDNSIYADRPGNSNGGANFLFVGATGNSVRRGLIRFDLSSLPLGIQVSEVSLELSVSFTPSGGEETHTLHRLLTDWGEGVVNVGGANGSGGGNGGPAGEGDATWASWDTPGGDFDPAASAEAPLASAGAVGLFEGAGLAADVQAWLDDPDSNFGWILIGEETGSRNARRIVSSEGEESQRPRLTIVFDIPSSVTTWMLYE